MVKGALFYYTPLQAFIKDYPKLSYLEFGLKQ
jgi:hypothetical protein